MSCLPLSLLFSRSAHPKSNLKGVITERWEETFREQKKSEIDVAREEEWMRPGGNVAEWIRRRQELNGVGRHQTRTQCVSQLLPVTSKFRVISRHIHLVSGLGASLNG
ncbi:hypothetical protein SUGI_1524110 [Cryptomeria japonica]|uniref:Uncharacterized protein n=1 Tax=Cryptomeria japonica TaxID=3369 RepID=A0AAD3NWD1_CRYJA|nr:hypothetical protein SUGI_1524110 [Cryptomeria japonica]